MIKKIKRLLCFIDENMREYAIGFSCGVSFGALVAAITALITISR